MNLQELIIWVFAFTVALGGSVNGLQNFGLLGFFIGGGLGLFAGLVAGVLITKLIFFLCFRKKPKSERMASRN